MNLQALIVEARELTDFLSRLRQAIAREAGLTRSRWEVLAAASSGAATVSRHARRLGLTRQSVQRTADLLVEEGLARFETNPEHRRSPLLRVTPQGAQVAVALDRTLRERLTILEELVEPEDLDSAVLALRALREEIAGWL